MNRRDEQIAEIVSRTTNLDPQRLVLFYDLVRQGYWASSIVDRVAVVDEIQDRTPSDFQVLTNQELRRIDHFNGPTYAWEMYCKELGRSVALGEENHLFETIQHSIPGATVSDGVGFGGLHDLVAELKANGYNPDFILAPISYMIGFYNDQQHAMEWDGQGRSYFLSQNERLEMLWSANGRPLDRFVIFDHHGGTWHVKLDPHANGGRLTVAIGEQIAPRAPHGVTWLAETVASYEITDPLAYRSFLPDTPLDRDFTEVR